MTKLIILLIISCISIQASATPHKGKNFDRVIFVVFENTNYVDAMKQPFFRSLAMNGANFSNFYAATHPSQGNYIALTSGATHGVKKDTAYNLNVRNIVDLLEDKGISWKVYAEGYPGNCFKGRSHNGYVRKHNPFISYTNIQNSSRRCANIVNAQEFDEDIRKNRLPEYIFYIPNIRNDGHDTGVAFADKWYERKFSKYFREDNFMSDTIVISTFDESRHNGKNRIYTSIIGPSIKPGSYSDRHTLASLLQLVEENWNLEDLGKEDRTANAIKDIWRR